LSKKNKFETIFKSYTKLYWKYKYIILSNLLNNIFVNNKICFIENNSYKITQKIKCKGTKQIFSSDTDFFKSEYYPNEVHKNKYK